MANDFFISFSSKDLPQVRLIMSALKEQDISFWDYSDKIQAEKPGRNLYDALADKIDSSEYFLAVTSVNSLKKKYRKIPRFEMNYAVNNGLLKNDKIILVLIPNSEGKYPNLEKKLKVESHSLIRNKIHLNFDYNNIESYIAFQRDICKLIKREYKPLRFAHKRLPFRNYFNTEVNELAHNNSSHIELVQIINEFNLYYAKGDLEMSYFLISHFLSSCRYRIPDYKIIYPWIIKAVIEQEMGKMVDAEKSYKEALKSDNLNPNAFGGLGRVYMSYSDYENAGKYFLKAKEHSNGQQKNNEYINYLLTKLASQKELSKDELEFIQNVDEESYEDEKEKSIVVLRKAIICYFIKDFSQSCQYFEKVGIENFQEPANFIYYFYSLKYSDNVIKAEKILKDVLKNTSKEGKLYNYREIILHLAMFYNEQGKMLEFEELFKKYLLRPDVRNRDIMIRYAKALYGRGKVKKANTICREILNIDLMGLPKTKGDFYFDGFAQFILGDHVRARYDYDRSGKWNKYYSDLF